MFLSFLLLTLVSVDPDRHGEQFQLDGPVTGGADFPHGVVPISVHIHQIVLVKRKEQSVPLKADLVPAAEQGQRFLHR